MKKRTALIGAILSLIPFGYNLCIKTGFILSTTSLMFFVSEKVNAETSNFYFDRGLEKGIKGDHYGAISDYTKVIEINSQYENAYYNRGLSKSKIKDYYGAISDYTKVIELNPNEKSAFKNRGIDKENIGDLQGACSDWRRTTVLSPSDAAARWVKEQC